jgi:hypothetical protein
VSFDCTYSTCRTEEGGKEERVEEREAVEEKKLMQSQSQTIQA